MNTWPPGSLGAAAASLQNVVDRLRGELSRWLDAIFEAAALMAVPMTESELRAVIRRAHSDAQFRLALEACFRMGGAAAVHPLFTRVLQRERLRAASRAGGQAPRLTRRQREFATALRSYTRKAQGKGRKRNG